MIKRLKNINRLLLASWFVLILMLYFLLFLDSSFNSSFCLMVVLCLLFNLFSIDIVSRDSKSTKRVVLVNLCLIVICLIAIESVLTISHLLKIRKAQPVLAEGSYNEKGYFVSDPNVGYKINEGPAVKKSKRTLANGDQIYDVSYSIDRNGFRQTPNNNDVKNSKCVIVMGGSFAFGEGLNDEETLASNIANLSNNKLRTINLGVHGYGPHHVLAWIRDSRFVDLVAGCGDNTQVILVEAAFSLDRTLGRSPWDLNGPRFILKSNKLVRVGNFRDFVFWGTFLIPSRITKLTLMDCHICNLLIPNHSGDDFVFYGKLHEAIRVDLMRLFPNGNLNILFWDYVDSNSEQLNLKVIQSLMEYKSIRIMTASSLIPEFKTRGNEFEIQGDGHPNAYFTYKASSRILQIFKDSTLIFAE